MPPEMTKKEKFVMVGRRYMKAAADLWNASNSLERYKEGTAGYQRAQKQYEDANTEYDIAYYEFDQLLEELEAGS